MKLLSEYFSVASFIRLQEKYTPVVFCVAAVIFFHHVIIFCHGVY